MPDPSIVLAGGNGDVNATTVENFRESLTLATRDIFLLPLALIALALVASAMMTKWQNPISEAESTEPAVAGACGR